MTTKKSCQTKDEAMNITQLSKWSEKHKRSVIFKNGKWVGVRGKNNE